MLFTYRHISNAISQFEKLTPQEVNDYAHSNLPWIMARAKDDAQHTSALYDGRWVSVANKFQMSCIGIPIAYFIRKVMQARAQRDYEEQVQFHKARHLVLRNCAVVSLASPDAIARDYAPAQYDLSITQYKTTLVGSWCAVKRHKRAVDKVRLRNPDIYQGQYGTVGGGRQATVLAAQRARERRALFDSEMIDLVHIQRLSVEQRNIVEASEYHKLMQLDTKMKEA